MTKTELHALVDALPDESLDSAAILLRRAQDPVIAVASTGASANGSGRQ